MKLWVTLDNGFIFNFFFSNLTSKSITKEVYNLFQINKNLIGPFVSLALLVFCHCGFTTDPPHSVSTPYCSLITISVPYRYFCKHNSGTDLLISPLISQLSCVGPISPTKITIERVICYLSHCRTA